MVEFIEYKFTDARDFLNELRLSNVKWWTPILPEEGTDSAWQRNWIFRGESSAKEWRSLVPSAWRKESSSTLKQVKEYLQKPGIFKRTLDREISKIVFESHMNSLSEDEHNKKREQIALSVLQARGELQIVHSFIELADELGFKITKLPEWTAKTSFVSQYLSQFFPSFYTDREIKKRKKGSENIIWVHPSIALAQHHGLPTRLLDWTRNPMVAAFFAASGVKKTVKDDLLTVFAIHSVMMKQRIRLVSVPASENDYLRAQHAIFTLDVKADEFYLQNEFHPSLEDSVGLLPGPFAEVHYPKKFTLPVSEAPQLIRLLWLERVTQAHLMPTLDNVAEAVKTRLKWSGKPTRGVENE